MPDLIEVRPEGLYCAAGDFHIDPWRPVPRAVLTHGHSDHARSGSGRYWAAAPGLGLLHRRIGADADIVPLAYGEPVRFNGVRVSLHSAGHVLGSSQVRVEAGGEVWVASGDYKRDPDPTCAPFEAQRCDVFITEATFALPVYRWAPGDAVMREIRAWWQRCRDEGRTAVLFAYALGKAQRILAGLLPHAEATVYLHGALVPLVQVYRDAGIGMLPTEAVSAQPGKGFDWAGKLVIAPPSAAGTPWMRRFVRPSTGFASGWMRVRGNKRRRNAEHGFVLSDHADWPSLLRTVSDTGAQRVLVTHGHGDALIAVLREQGIDARALRTLYEGEAGAAAEALEAEGTA